MVREILKPGWINFKLLNPFLSERNIIEFCAGPRDNRTDGEWQRIYHQTNTGALFVCHANIWDALSFSPLLEWAEKYNWNFDEKQEKTISKLEEKEE